MSTLVDAYIEELAQGYVPDKESEEAKAFRAWSWAYNKLTEIKQEVRVMALQEELL